MCSPSIRESHLRNMLFFLPQVAKILYINNLLVLMVFIVFLVFFTSALKKLCSHFIVLYLYYESWIEREVTEKSEFQQV